VLVGVGAGILPFLAVTVPVHALLVVWTAVLVRDRVPLRPAFGVSAAMALVRPSIAFALATAVGITYQYLAQILTTFVADAEQAGLFAASFRVFIVAAAIPGLLLTSAFPLVSRAAQSDPDRLANVVRGLFQGSALLGVGAALTCVLGAEAIIELVNGPDYAGADDALRIHGAALLATFVLATWGFTLLALHRHRVMVFANLASLAVTAAVVSVLAASNGAEGAALGTLAGESVLGLGYLWAVTRERRDFGPPLVWTLQVAAIAGAALAAGTLAGLGPVADTAIGLLVFVALTFALRAVPPDLLVLLPAGVRRRLPGP
jgi:O-antigen/teichoic acid export membrane protein